MDRTTRTVMAAVAGLLAAGMAGFGQAQAHAEAESTAHCYGINKCKGTGDCGGKTNGCHGANDCKGQAWIGLSKENCLRIEGGRLTEEPAAPAEGAS